MHKAIRTTLIFLTLICFAWPVSAAELNDVVKGVREFYKDKKDLTAQFTQTADIKAMGTKKVRTGTVMFKQPDKMRWDYKKPTQEQLLTDGFTLWNYKPADKTVFMSPLNAVFNAKVPMQILAGKIDVNGEFNATLAEDTGDRYKLILKPKKEGVGYDSAVLWLNKKTYEIQQIDVIDLYGNVTSLALSGIKYNSGIADSEFAYTPKPGVEVMTSPVM